jgi:ribonuclease J
MTKKEDRWIKKKLSGTASVKKIKTPTYKKGYKPPRHKKHHNKRHRPGNKKVRIIPLGGLEEVGKNMMVIEYDGSIIIVDMGFQFPEEDMLGIDYVIPDISWLEEHRHKIRGVIITHGHLDHTGAIPYVLPKLNFPKIFATKLTAGLIEKRVEEFGIKKDTVLNIVDPDDIIRLGPFTVKYFRVNHSVPDGVGVIIETPEGTIVNTGDFKFDYTPADQVQADYDKLAELGQKNSVEVLFSDSTNAIKPGHTVSEKTIGDNLDKIIKETSGRIIIASFSSLIGRIQQILDSAKKWNRKVFLSGRSLIDNIAIAERLNYLKIPKGLINDIRHAEKVPGKDSLILTTGSQGEAVSALTRISLKDHKHIKIKKGDTVVISATPIIGNERAINTVIDNLTMLGARVINNKIMDVHTSGHACQEDLKMMIGLVKPKYFVPVHGQYHMRYAHKELAVSMGIPEQNCIMINNGNILELKNKKLRVSKEKAETNYILVDGLGMGDSGSRVIVERQKLAENGVIVVTLKINKKTKRLIGTPSIETRGFIYLKESEEIVKEVKKKIKTKYIHLLKKHPKPGEHNIKQYIASVIDKYTHKKLARRPLIVPIVVEV